MGCQFMCALMNGSTSGCCRDTGPHLCQGRPLTFGWESTGSHEGCVLACGEHLVGVPPALRVCPRHQALGFLNSCV